MSSAPIEKLYAQCCAGNKVIGILIYLLLAQYQA